MTRHKREEIRISNLRTITTLARHLARYLAITAESGECSHEDRAELERVIGSAENAKEKRKARIYGKAS